MSDQNTTNIPNAAAILQPLLAAADSLSDDSLRLAIEDAVKRLFWSEAFEVGSVLVTSMIVGADERKIMEITGMPAETIQGLAGNLRQYGVWKGKQAPVEYWLHPRLGYWNLLCDGLVAKGKVMRRYDTYRGVVYYAMPGVSAHLN